MTKLLNLTVDCEPEYQFYDQNKGVTTNDESDDDNQMADKQKVRLSTTIYERVSVITRHPRPKVLRAQISMV
jgi:hypothetical protein